MKNRFEDDEEQARLPILIKPFTREEEGYDETLDELITRMKFLRSYIGKNIYTYYNGVFLSTLDELFEGELKDVYKNRLNTKRKFHQIASTTSREEVRRILLSGKRRGYVALQINNEDSNGKEHSQVIYVDRMYLDKFNPDHLNTIINYRMLASESLGSLEYYQEILQKKEEMSRFKKTAEESQSENDIDY